MAIGQRCGYPDNAGFTRAVAGCANAASRASSAA
jgi:hypothetical protein